MKDYKVVKALFSTSGGARGGAVNVRIPLPAEWASEMKISKENKELALFRTENEVIIAKTSSSFYRNKHTNQLLTETEYDLLTLREGISLYNNLDEDEKEDTAFEDFLIKLSEEEQDYEKLIYSQIYNDWMTVEDEEFRNNQE